MKLLIGADLVPTKTHSELFAKANTEELLGKALKDVLDSADYRIFNLETPLTDVATPIAKCGPCLRADTATVAGIKGFGTDFLTLANNHIMDQGAQGWCSTKQALQNAGIAYAGIGDTLAEASAPHIVTVEGVKVGIYCCAEHEFTIATDTKPGANPYDPLESFDAVRDLRSQCDYLIVLYHGGKEYCRYPSPNVRKMCRKFVDCGADVVLCQHTHCIGCEENYAGKKIVYGQGNFLFDHSEKEEWQTSLLVECDVTETGAEVRYYPLRKQGNTTSLAEAEDAEQIMNGFYTRSQELLSDETWHERYREFALKSYEQLMFRINGKLNRSVFYRGMNRLFGDRWAKWYLRTCYDRQAKIVLRNTVESESWRELLIEAINATSNLD